MSWQWWLLVVALLLAVFVAIYLSSTAGRLDRLHHRVDVSRANLVAELRRRRDLTDHVAAIGVVDPASALLLADAVGSVAAAEPSGDSVGLYLAESDLSAVLAAVFSDPLEVDEIIAAPGGEAVERLADACRRVQIGRRFYNDAVNGTRAVRQGIVVRTFHLQGTAPMPETVEMIDTLPAGFAGR
ncbi:MAG: hypothetical protein E6Q90_09410 [Actinobacteria bacterium]|nr:MAG: hypothetical protein E6Q90_09410 [Actinomycetota bacterium]